MLIQWIFLFLAIGSIIFLAIYRPKSENYLLLKQVGRRLLNELNEVESETDLDYDRHHYDRFNRRFPFLNQKNVQFNEV